MLISWAKPFVAQKTRSWSAKEKKCHALPSPDGHDSLPAASTPGRWGPSLQYPLLAHLLHAVLALCDGRRHLLLAECARFWWPWARSWQRVSLQTAVMLDLGTGLAIRDHACSIPVPAATPDSHDISFWWRRPLSAIAMSMEEELCRRLQCWWRRSSPEQRDLCSQ